MENQFDLSHVLGHVFSASAIVGAIAGWFPAVAGVVALIWYLLQILESARVQRWLRAHHACRIARLKAKLLRLEAKAGPL